MVFRGFILSLIILSGFLSSTAIAGLLSSTQVVDGTNDVGQYADISVVNENTIFASYFDQTNTALKFARTTDGGASFEDFTLESSGVVGSYTSIDAVDANTIFICYYEGTVGDELRLAKSTDGGDSFSYSTIDGASANTGSFCSIEAIDANTVFVSSYDITNADLRFAVSTNGGSSFTLSSVDTTNTVGEYSSISTPDTNTIHIAYYDGTNADLKFARSLDGGSSFPLISTIDSTDNVGRYASIASDSNDVFISYFDETNGNLEFISSSDGGGSFGTPVTVDSTAGNSTGVSGVARITDIDFLDSNMIYITYYAFAANELRFAYTTDGGSSWSTDVIEGIGTPESFGQATAVEAVDDQNIFTVYHHNGDGDLKFADMQLGLHVESSTPSANAIDASLSTDIVVVFDESLNTGTVTTSNFVVSASQTGFVSGVISFSTTNVSNDTVTFNPDADFKPGERVFLHLTENIQSSAGSTFNIPQMIEFTTEAPQGVGTFDSQTLYTTGAEPRSLEVGDLNNDGHIDLVAADHDDDTISVFINNGDGSFANRVTYLAGNGPSARLSLADFDNDGDLDIVTGNTSSDNDISFFFNNGDGTFGAKVDRFIGSAPNGTRAGDLNGDGLIDVIASDLNNRLSVLLNAGGGSFGTADTYNVGFRPNNNFEVGDFDADGDLDIVVTDSASTDTIQFLLNNGDGTFQIDFTLTASHTNVNSPRFADLNGDGWLDLIVSARTSTGRLNVFLNNGDGTLNGTPIVTVMTNSSPRAVRIADVDADGDLDVLSSSANRQVEIFLNDGSANLTPSGTYAFGNGSSVTSGNLTTGDFDSDGDIDFAASAGSRLDVWFNQLPVMDVISTSPAANALDVSQNSNITIVFEESLNTGTVDQSSLPIYGSLSGLIDGVYSFSTTTVSNDTVIFNPTVDFHVGEKVWINVSTDVQAVSTATVENGFLAEFRVEVTGGTATFTTTNYVTASDNFDVTVSDFDDDGLIDIAVVARVPNTLYVLINNGSGGFDPAVSYATTASLPVQIESGDVDRDGDIDLIVTYNNTIDNDFSVFLNAGDGTFPVRNEYDTGSGPFGTSVVDFNGDGFLDLAISNRSADTIGIHLNDGTGAYPSFTEYATATFPFVIAIGDLDKDGDIDLATTSNTSSNISVLLNNGDGTFAARVDYPVIQNTSGIRIADLDGDSYLDIVTSTGGLSDGLAVLLNDGDGTFTEDANHATGNGVWGVLEADVDNDGDFDLFSANQNDSNISFLEANGDGTFAAQTTLLGLPTNLFLEAADFNDDGALDIVLTGPGSTSIRVYANGVNAAPTVNPPNPPSQATDGSGYITFETTIDDSTDLDTTRLQVQYSDDGGSNFYDAFIVSATPDSGTVDVDNGTQYQIGSTDAIDTDGGSVSLTMVWDSQNAGNGNGPVTGEQSDIIIRLTPNDFIDDGFAEDSPTFTIDNQNPVGLTALTDGTSTQTSQELMWSAVTENNFDHYEIWYGENQSDVVNRTGAAIEWDGTDDANLNTIGTTSTTITGLTAGAGYFFKIFAIDSFGNVETVLELSLQTVSNSGRRRRSEVAPIAGSVSTEPSEIIEDTTIEQEGDLKQAAEVLESEATTLEGLSKESITSLGQVRALKKLYAWMYAEDYQLVDRYQLVQYRFWRFFNLRETIEILAEGLGYEDGVTYRKPQRNDQENVAELLKVLVLNFHECFDEELFLRMRSHDIPENSFWWAGYWHVIGDVVPGEYKLWDSVFRMNLFAIVESLIINHCSP